MGAMSVHLHALVSEIDNLCLHNATFRLVSYLLTQVPEGVDETSHIRLSVPKTTLAARLSIQRETLSRLLARLRERRLVDVHGQEIVLRDIPSLRKLTDQ
jgi:CRP-like cAMP-binding protein